MTETEHDLRYGPEDFADSDLEDSDADFVPRPPRRLSGATIALITCAAIGAGFLGGVLTQKHHDSGLTASGSAASLRTAFAGAARAGGFGGLGGAAGGTGAGAAAGSSSGTGAGTGADAAGTAAAVPSVIGTLTSVTATSAVVTNLGGAKVSVRLTSTTTVTAPLGSAGALKAGEQVSVYGTKATDGVVTATSLTVR